jgi:hypothetical protein
MRVTISYIMMYTKSYTDMHVNERPRARKTKVHPEDEEL